MADINPQDFLLFLVCSIAECPDAVSIDESDDDNGRTVYQVSVAPDDKATITEGELADALHTAFSAFTYKHRIRASLDLRG